MSVRGRHRGAPNWPQSDLICNLSLERFSSFFNAVRVVQVMSIKVFAAGLHKEISSRKGYDNIYKSVMLSTKASL